MYDHEELIFWHDIEQEAWIAQLSLYFDRFCSLGCYLIPIISDYNIAGLITPLDL